MLHYYLENHGLNATVLHFNADNCTGYLYDKIRRYCREECKDLTCPLPEAPRPVSSSRQSTPGIDEAPELGMEIELPQSDTETNAPPTKKRQCGNCGQYGHNRRCPNSDN